MPPSNFTATRAILTTPAVCELDGPMPTVKRSKMLMAIDFLAWDDSSWIVRAAGDTVAEAQWRRHRSGGIVARTTKLSRRIPDMVGSIASPAIMSPVNRG